MALKTINPAQFEQFLENRIAQEALEAALTHFLDVHEAHVVGDQIMNSRRPPT